MSDDGDVPIAVKYAYVLTQVWSGTNPDGASFIDLKGKYKSANNWQRKNTSFIWLKREAKAEEKRAHVETVAVRENEAEAKEFSNSKSNEDFL